MPINIKEPPDNIRRSLSFFGINIGVINISILRKRDLYQLTSKPTINQIALKRLLEYYDEYIAPYRFTYELDNKEIIELECLSENFSHLIGVGKYQSFVPRREQYKYTGQVAYDCVASEEITKDTLKRYSLRTFNNNKDKLIYFYLIPKILKGSKLFVEYSKTETTNIEAKLLAYSEEEEAIVHLALDYSEGTNKYYPRSLFVERINANSDGTKFIANGDKIEIVKTIITSQDGKTKVIEHKDVETKEESATHLSSF